MKLRLPRFIRADFFRKFIAVVFAVLLWFYVSGQMRETETFRGVPVILNYDSGVVSLERETVAVDVVLRGAKNRLLRVTPADVHLEARIPSEAVDRGMSFYDLAVLPEMASVPTGLSVVEISPAKVRIPLDRMETRTEVPVRVRFSGALREGYKIASVSVVPSKIDVTGPGKLLPDITELLTEPVPLDDTLSAGFEMEARVLGIPRVKLHVGTVHVRVEIAKQTMQQTYRDLPVFVLAGASSPVAVAAPLPPVSVTVQGPQDVMETLDGFSVRPFVDISGMKAPGTSRRAVQVWCGGAAGVIVESIQPSVVDVTVAPADHGPAPADAKPAAAKDAPANGGGKKP